jgi:putative glutamine amidotransferase
MLRMATDTGDPGGRYDGAPLVGVTTSEIRRAGRVDPTPEGEPARAEMALGLTYLRAIEAAGGLPVVLPPLPIEAIGPLLDGLDGICLSGGPDLDPAEYGQDPHDELGPTWRELDVAELAVAREADARGLPILAICRGAQALNVSRRGTLFQHLVDRFGAEVEHRQGSIGTEPVHRVEIDPDSRLAKALGETCIEVNSFHHQAADQLGRGLRAVGFSPDGVIEAIEAPGSRFVVGVQWHAESLTERPEQAGLFRAFVDAARGAPARQQPQAA